MEPRDEPPLTCEEARALTEKKIPGTRLFRPLGIAYDIVQQVGLVILVAVVIIGAIMHFLQ